MAHPTKKDLALGYIRRQILERRYLPGQRITASHVAAEIGTSVLPVREALLALQAERLVTITPYVGAVVAWASTDAIVDVIRLLAVLEGFATAEAFERAADGLIEPLEEVNEQLRTAAAEGRWSAFIDLNRAFHFRLYDACGNQQAIETIRLYWSQLDAMLVATAFHTRPNRTADDLREHDAILHLMRHPDTDRLEIELAVRRHRMRTAAYLEELAQARA